MSALDILDYASKNPTNLYELMISGDTQMLDPSTDYWHLLSKTIQDDTGYPPLVLINCKNLNFWEKSFTDSDGLEYDVDTVILANGYENTSQGIFELDGDEWPLYLRTFYIDDPSLTFPGLCDENPFSIFVLEK